jgi:hypothetical protein
LMPGNSGSCPGTSKCRMASRLAPLTFILYRGTKKDCTKGKKLRQFDLKIRWSSWS